MSFARALPTFLVASLGVFVVVLDNLVVTTALPAIRDDLGATLEQLEWTVNAYTLTFAVLLLTGAAAGDRFGRKRVFMLGLTVFTAASALSALAPSIDALVAARALQGVGAAIVMPLSLTLVADALGRERRGLALGLWSAVAGVAVALGPIVGGAVVEGISWQWIFWLNVPVGLVAVPLAALVLRERRGPEERMDIPGVALVSGGLLGVVWGLVHGNADGWTDPAILAALGGGAALLLGFVAWEARTPQPMLPLRLFRDRSFSAANVASLLMYLGLFGAVFLMTQFFQTAQGLSPLDAGLRILPWTIVPMFIAPVAGILSDRIGGGLLMAVGLALQAGSLAWFALVAAADTSYADLIAPFILGGIGSGLFYAPVANVVLSAVPEDQEGRASGASNAIREVGGVLGVAVLAAVFSHAGGLGTPETFVDGFVPALWTGAAIVMAGALASLLIRRPGRAGVPVARTRLDGAPSMG